MTRVSVDSATVAKFMSLTDRGDPSGCWLWKSNTDGRGYARFSPVNGTRIASRIAWQIAHGEIPDGVVCHKCDNPLCVNPDHLWVGTQRENIRDMVVKGRQWRQKRTHCAQGHEFTPENTYTSAGRGRDCLTCKRARAAETRRRRRERQALLMTFPKLIIAAVP